MLELVRSSPQPRIARYDPAWDDLDEAHAAVWDAVRHLFPAHAMVDQADYGCLVVSWLLREGARRASHFAAPVVIRIEPGLLLALWTCDEESRRDIASLQAAIVEEALDSYDPHSRETRCGVIVLGE
ncbi:hypothetical protein [Ramlibacter sp. PS4R-6]|uniref:hypothetical protein n=1 Tax=Ramlibacter sp. PS4R-6 TaxID=3133438 RepID=UPI0030ABA483